MSEQTESSRELQQRSAWVLYDGSCRFCTRFIERWRATLGRAGFAIAPLQSSWVSQQTKIPAEHLVNDFRVLTPAGELISGSEAYLYILRRLNWGKPLAALFSIPGINFLFDGVYRIIRRYRSCL